MSLSLPAKVVAVKGKTVTIAANGVPLVVQRGSIENIGPGDWVLVNGSLIESVITAAEALAHQKLWSELVEITTGAV